MKPAKCSVLCLSSMFLLTIFGSDAARSVPFTAPCSMGEAVSACIVGQCCIEQPCYIFFTCCTCTGGCGCPCAPRDCSGGCTSGGQCGSCCGGNFAAANLVKCNQACLAAF